MTEFKLLAKKRKETGKKVRHLGLIPAVVYGNEIKSESIAVEKINFNKLFKEAGTSNLVDLIIDEKESFKTLVHDIQQDPVSLDIIHIDFYKVNMKEKIRAEVPLVFVGESRAVIDQEGSLITPKDAVEVECLPSDLPPSMEVDISILDDFEKDIRVSNLSVLADVEILDDPEEVIAHVEAPRSEEELAALEEEVVEDVSAVEVETAGEEVVEGEEGVKTTEDELAPAEGEKKEEEKK